MTTLQGARQAIEFLMRRITTIVKKTQSGSKNVSVAGSPSRRTKEQRDWRAKLLDCVRKLIQQADPEVVEEVKWRKPSNPAGVPVWSHDGIICTGETYKNAVKLTFAKGAALADPARLFNSSMEGNTRRAIDFREGDQIDEKALMALVRAAVALNTAAQNTRGRPSTGAACKAKQPTRG